MKPVLIDRLIDKFEEQINSDIPENDITDSSPPFTIDAATFYEFEEYLLNALKQLRSKLKTLTIVVVIQIIIQDTQLDLVNYKL
jgi:hypothetical protein